MHKTLDHTFFEFPKKALITWSMYHLESNTKHWNQRLVHQPTSLDGYTKLNITAKVHLYKRTEQYLVIESIVQEQVKIPLVFPRALFTRFQNLNTWQLISLTVEVWTWANFVRCLMLRLQVLGSGVFFILCLTRLLAIRS